MAERLNSPADTLRALDVLPRQDIPAAIARLAARLLTEMPPPAPAPSRTERLLTPAEAAGRLGVAPRWVYRHARELGAVALSRRTLRVSEAAVERYLTRRSRAAQP